MAGARLVVFVLSRKQERMRSSHTFIKIIQTARRPARLASARGPAAPPSASPVPAHTAVPGYLGQLS